MTATSDPTSPRDARPFDIVLWGATGFTGQLVAEYLVRNHSGPCGVRLALGGRSQEKLEKVRAELRAVDPKAAEIPLILGDARDPASLSRIAGSTRVIISTVGPYAIHGRELVAACVEQGTDYCDLTGETNFVREMIDRHHRAAAASGARIVHCCGFDSIPSDLGVLMLQDAMRERRGAPCVEVKFFVGPARGGASGGTVASIIGMVEQSSQDRGLRRLLADPYALDPDRPGPGPDGRDQAGVRWDPDIRAWTGPFVMAAINTRVVRRTNALLGYAWGRDFRYAEAMRTGTGPKGLVTAALTTAAVGGGLAALAFSPARRLLQRTVLPAPGEGPSREAQQRGFFVVRLIGRAADGSKVEGTVKGVGDPGYSETAKMLSESAVSLARDPRLTGGGVLTPAYALGAPLIARLRRAGMTFEVA